MADTTGTELSFGKTLIGDRLMATWWRRHCGNESMVGICCPPRCRALANIPYRAGKVTVNLNFTSGAGALRSALEQCGIKTILDLATFLSEGRPRGAAGMVL